MIAQRLGAHNTLGENPGSVPSAQVGEFTAPVARALQGSMPLAVTAIAFSCSYFY